MFSGKAMQEQMPLCTWASLHIPAQEAFEDPKALNCLIYQNKIQSKANNTLRSMLGYDSFISSDLSQKLLRVNKIVKHLIWHFQNSNI